MPSMMSRLVSTRQAFLLFGGMLLIGLGLFTSASRVQAAAYTASDVLGQRTTGDAADFTKALANNAQDAGGRGLSAPQDVAVDTTHHRLFVADKTNNRVLVFNLNSSDQLLDHEADAVLGQANFSSTSTASSQAGLSSPTRLAYDGTTDRLFVSDRGNQRVVVYDVAAITNGENAAFVLGQSNFTSSTAGTAVNKFNGPQGLAIDSAGQRLFAVDANNNRVLVFDISSISNGEGAVNVLGQVNFTSSTPGTTTSTLNTPDSVAFDSSDQRLYVTEFSNHRVIVFDVTSISDGENAVNVLGQANFTSSGSAITQSGMSFPAGVAVDSSGRRLFVVNNGSNRILVFDIATTTNGENAISVLGQSTFTSSSAATTQNGLDTPRGIAFNPTANLLYVAEELNNRVTIFNAASPISNGANATDNLGQLDANDEPVYTTSNANNGATTYGANNKGLYGPRYLALDTTNHRLFVSDRINNRIMIFNLNSDNQLADYTADAVLGQSSFTASISTTTQSGLVSPRGLVFQPSTNLLYVADSGNNRVMVFDVASISNGENAVFVLGQPDFTTASAGTTQSKLNNPTSLTIDSTGGRLFVADSDNNRIVIFNTASGLSNGQSALNVLGQSDFTTALTTAARNKINIPRDIAFDAAGQRLFVAESGNHRITVFDVEGITDGENARNVLGQPNFTSASPGTTDREVFAPFGLVYDSSDQRLFVGDSSNNRVLVFDVATIDDGEAAVKVIGQSDFVSSSSGATTSTFQLPNGLAFNPTDHRLYVADTNNNRVLVFNTIRLSTSPLSSGTRASSFSQSVTTTNSQNSLQFSIASGTLPNGLSINSSNGTISGIPTAEGTFTFTVAAADVDSSTGYLQDTQNYSITINSDASGSGGSSSGSGSSISSSGGGGSIIQPTNLRLLINNGALTTSNQQVTLTLQATDAAEMKVDNDPSFTSSAWEPFTRTKPWTLTSGYGTKVVYVKFRAANGYISNTVTSSIEYSSTGAASVVTSSPSLPLPSSPSPASDLSTLPNPFTLLPPLNLLKSNRQIGSTGTDVRVLQKFLNSNGFTLAGDGPGSPGKETTYFGPLTRAALTRFQDIFVTDLIKSNRGKLELKTRTFINKIGK